MKKYLLLLMLFSAHLLTMSEEDKNDFILFDYTKEKTSCEKEDFTTIAKKDPIKGFHLWAYNQIHQHCRKHIRENCFGDIITIGAVKQKPFLDSLKNTYPIHRDIVNIIGEDAFKSLRTLKNINAYINAFEHIYLQKEDKITVFEHLLNNLDIENLDITGKDSILNSDDNLITILLKHVANFPINDANFSKIIALLKSKKLDDFINFILNTKIEIANNTKEEEKQNVIDDFINQAAALDEKKDKETSDIIIDYLDKLHLSDWIKNIITKQITIKENKELEEKVKSEEEKKKLEKEDELKYLEKKIKPGLPRKLKKGKSKRTFDEVTCGLDKVSKEKKDSTNKNTPIPTTKESKSSEQIKLNEDTKKEIDTFNKFDFNKSNLEALEDLVSLTNLSLYSPEEINFTILLYNIYQKQIGSKNMVDYHSSDETTLLEELQKTYNIDLSTTVKEGLANIENRADDANLYLNAIIKDFSDKKLNLVSSNVKETIEKVASIDAFPLIKNHLANIQQKITSQSQKNVSSISSPTTSVNDSLELFSAGLLSIIQK